MSRLRGRFHDQDTRRHWPVVRSVEAGAGRSGSRVHSSREHVRRRRWRSRRARREGAGGARDLDTFGWGKVTDEAQLSVIAMGASEGRLRGWQRRLCPSPRSEQELQSPERVAMLGMKQAKGAHAMKVLGRHVLQKAAQELFARQRHGLALTVAGIAIAERHRALAAGDDRPVRAQRRTRRSLRLRLALETGPMLWIARTVGEARRPGGP